MKQIEKHKNKYLKKYFKYSSWEKDKPKNFNEMLDYVEAVKADKIAAISKSNNIKLHRREKLI